MIEAPESAFESSGARRFKAALGAGELHIIAGLFDLQGGPGKRLDATDLRPIVQLLGERGSIGAIASSLLERPARPVRALLLDKSPAANWRLGWHQDRTIAVQERIELDGFGPWSTKAGQLHVQPPHWITDRMVTLRLHVDTVDDANGPLRVLPGSHLLGQLSSEAVENLASTTAPLTCLADAGDVWAYRTAIVHASAEQLCPGRRRVLQLDYSADSLPGGLRWASLIAELD
ncbi:MAG: phytanoyl-CoA dioxygenase family protein [Pseudomonadota bacterium]|nr:phytanoyl-CoA dioxygenase family protein [Pseudomonadota bacterium]